MFTYEGKHALIFENEYGTKNTWTDWHLVPTSRPTIAPPEVRTNYVEIPGRNGTVDVSEILTGYPTYKDRQGTLEFAVDTDYQDWNLLYADIATYLHGQRMKMTLTDQPEYYYEGRFGVASWTSGKDYPTVSIKYTLDPYKKEAISSIDRWKWDPFNFYTGVIRETSNISITGNREIRIVGSIQRTCPVITVSGPATLTYKEKKYSLKAGNNQFPDLIIDNTEYEDRNYNVFTFDSGNTNISVTIYYRGGAL